MFRWLNLTDIHVGMSDQDWLWPNLKHELYDDLTRVVAKSGPLDAIIFSGDLVQKGSADEFRRFTEIIGEIIDRLSELGKRPPLIVAPGNHDLVRPKAGAMLEVALRQVPADPDVLKAVLDPTGEFLPQIKDLFAPFIEWQNKMIADGLHARPVAVGLFPGDASYCLQASDMTSAVGIVTLNSTWLQISPGDYQSRLHVDPRQLLAVTDHDPVVWCSSKWSRLLVTHHPTEWLTPGSIRSWNSELFPPDRFDLHLFGHMHDHDASSTQRGGGGTRRSIQGASIFGLERIDKGVNRSHGYSICEIADVGGARQLKVWPRTLVDIRGGDRRLAPDLAQGLTEENFYSWTLSSSSNSSHDLSRRDGAGKEQNLFPDAPDVVATIAPAQADKLRYYLINARAHLAIRRVERARAQEAIEAKAALWVWCEWGAGEDGFIWSLLSDVGQTDSPIFRLEIDAYRDRAAYLNDFHFANGFTFEHLCEYLSGLSNSILLLDSIQTPVSQQPGQKPFEQDLEEICDIIREYAPSTKVILRGRFRKEDVSLPFVELQPLEEPDVADYVRAHELGGEDRSSSMDIGTMWRHTSGSPVRLDALLRDLEVTSLTDLMSNDLEYRSGVGQTEVPPALAATVTDLRTSEMDLLSRSYQMLEALSSLPRGEQFDRMRRFLGPHGFWPQHVHELTDRGLVESVHLSGMATAQGRTASRALLVPRIVREFIRDNMTPDRRREIDTRALELYFGGSWKSGEITSSMAGKRCADPLCEPYEIVNASVLIQRLMLSAHEESDTLTLEAGIRLASAFLEILMDGYHHASVANLCSQILPLVDNEKDFARQADVLRYSHARSLRMLGELDEARQLFETIDPRHLSSRQKRQMSLNLALLHEKRGDDADAALHAKEVIKNGRKDGPGIQAQSIIAQQGRDDQAVIAELKKLEAQARKIDADVAANNIALDLAEREKGQASTEHIERVISSTNTKKDFLNGSRAIVRAMKKRIGSNAPTTDFHLTKLIEAYQHLYNERAGNLFDQCHDALWSIFHGAGDISNLFRLFRHSSLIWRLRGQENREKPYLSVLAQLDAHVPARKLVGLDRELTYYRARTAAALDRLDASPPVPLVQKG